MPNITVREYHSDSGALLGNISTLKFGKVSAGTTSRVKVIDIAFDNVSSVGNVKMGIVSSGGVSINSDPQDFDNKNTSSNGNFGIEDSPFFDSSKASEPLARHFPGANGSGASNDDNNVLVGTRSSDVSNYIYLDVKVGASASGSANGAYKVFFDYS